MVFGDMRVQRRYVNSSATKTPCSPIGRLGRQAQLRVPHTVFPSVPVPAIAVRLKVGFRPVRKKYSPCTLEIGTGFLESWRGPVGVLTRMTAGIEAATPFPRVCTGRIADADRNRSGLHVAIETCQQSGRS